MERMDMLHATEGSTGQSCERGRCPKRENELGAKHKLNALKRLLNWLIDASLHAMYPVVKVRVMPIARKACRLLIGSFVDRKHETL